MRLEVEASKLTPDVQHAAELIVLVAVDKPRGKVEGLDGVVGYEVSAQSETDGIGQRS